MDKATEAYSLAGVDRVVPIRFVRVLNAGETNLELGKYQYAVQRANNVYRPAGVQFYIGALDVVVAPTLSDARYWIDKDGDGVDDGAAELVELRWDEVRADIRKVLPTVPLDAFAADAKKTVWGWMHWTTAKWSAPKEVLVWVSSNSIGSQGAVPWDGRSIVTNPWNIASETNFPHEMGHFLGLAHTFELESSGPDPEAGQNLGLTDFWDLIYGTTAGSATRTLFASKAEAAAFRGTLQKKNFFSTDRQNVSHDNCVQDLSSCVLRCTLPRNPGEGADSFEAGSAELTGLAFTPRGGGLGLNVMSYTGQTGCYDHHGISASQVAQVRKVLNYPMKGLATGTPLPTYRNVLGSQPIEPNHTLDFDGDGARDIAVFRPPAVDGATGLASGTGQFRVLLSSQRYKTSKALIRDFGTLGDIPIPADYDGDGRTDMAVYRTMGNRGTDPSDPAAYWIFCPSRLDHDCTVSRVDVPGVGSVLTTQQFGQRGDIPLPEGDFDGNPVTGALTVYRPSNGRFVWRNLGSVPDQVVELKDDAFVTELGAIPFGVVPFIGKLDADEKTDLVLYAPQGRNFKYKLSTNNYATQGAKSFPAGTGATTLVRRRAPRANNTRREAFAIYDHATGIDHTVWELAATAVSSCAIGSSGARPIGGYIDRDRDGRSDLVTLWAQPGKFEIVFKNNNNGSCTGATKRVALSEQNSRIVYFATSDVSLNGGSDLWSFDPDNMVWSYTSSSLDFAADQWRSVAWGVSGDLPL